MSTQPCRGLGVSTLCSTDTLEIHPTESYQNTYRDMPNAVATAPSDSELRFRGSRSGGDSIAYSMVH